MSLLVVERGSHKGQRIPLKKFPILAGRDDACDIVIDDLEASRKHFTIKKRGKLFIIIDLESRNGIYLNGDRVINAILSNGDKILIGRTEFQFFSQQAPIEFSGEIDEYNIVVAEELGLSGPLPLERTLAAPSYEVAVRLNKLNPIAEYSTDTRFHHQLFDFVSDLQVIFNLEDLCEAVLKQIGILLPNASRAAFFTWSSTTNLLSPKAIRHFSQKKNPFILSKKTFEDAINRKQGVILAANAKSSAPSVGNRIILPMVYDNEPICVIHIESDDPATKLTEDEVRKIQALISSSAGYFESLILRSELDGWIVGMLETLIATIEAKDTYTHGHSQRVARYSMAIAEQLRLDRHTKRLLLASALCHDIGKIGIHDSILKKAAMLSAEEYEEMKLHPTIGAEIISHMPNAQKFISGVKYHHEKWDGTGYPEGLVGEEIPFFARIVCIADVFDAMISGRSYSGFIDESQAIEKLTEERDLFDPDILNAFVKAYESGLLTLKTSTQNNVVDNIDQNEKEKNASNAKNPKKNSKIQK